MFWTRPEQTAGIQSACSGTSRPVPRTCRTMSPRLTVSSQTCARSTLGAAGLRFESPRVVPARISRIAVTYITQRRFRSLAAFGSAISIRFQPSCRGRARRMKTRKCQVTRAFRQRGFVATFACFPAGGTKPSHKWERVRRRPIPPNPHRTLGASPLRLEGSLGGSLGRPARRSGAWLEEPGAGLDWRCHARFGCVVETREMGNGPAGASLGA